MWKALSVGLALGATAAFAQSPSEAPDGPRGPDNDPNQMVSQNQTEIGSRVSRRRVCRTRAEWEDLRVQQRRTVEKVQFFKQTCDRPPCG